MILVDYAALTDRTLPLRAGRRPSDGVFGRRAAREVRGRNPRRSVTVTSDTGQSHRRRAAALAQQERGFSLITYH